MTDPSDCKNGAMSPFTNQQQHDVVLKREEERKMSESKDSEIDAMSSIRRVRVRFRTPDGGYFSLEKIVDNEVLVAPQLDTEELAVYQRARDRAMEEFIDASYDYFNYYIAAHAAAFERAQERAPNEPELEAITYFVKSAVPPRKGFKANWPFIDDRMLVRSMDDVSLYSWNRHFNQTELLVEEAEVLLTNENIVKLHESMLNPDFESDIDLSECFVTEWGESEEDNSSGSSDDESNDTYSESSEDGYYERLFPDCLRWDPIIDILDQMKIKEQVGDYSVLMTEYRLEKDGVVPHDEPIVYQGDEPEYAPAFDDQFDVQKQLLAEVPKVKKVSKPLNVGAKIFIPAYNPSISLLDVLSLIEEKNLDSDEKRDLLLAKGYPAWWAQKIASSKPNNLGVQYAKTRESRKVDRHFNEVGKGTKAAPIMLQQSQVKSSGNLWRIYPRPGSPLVDKPTEFNNSKFVAWVYGVAWQLQFGITRKTQFITGNSACETLFKTSTVAASSREVDRLLEKACVYVEDYKDLSRKPPSVRMSEYVPDLPREKKSLDICGVIVSSIEELAQFELSFKRHKPLYKAAMTYFIGIDEVDVKKLQASIHEKIVKPVVYVDTYQGRRFSVTSLDDDLNDWKRKIKSVLIQIRNFEFFNDSYQGIFDYLPGLPGVPKLLIDHNLVLPPLPEVVVNHRFSLGVSDEDPMVVERVTMQVFTLLAQLRIAPSWEHAFLSVMQFVAGNETASGLLIRALKRGLSIVTYQGDEANSEPEKTKHFWDQPISLLRKELVEPLWEAVVSCSLMTLISEFFQSIKNELCLPIPDLVKSIKASIIREGATSLAKSIIAGIMECIDRLKRCISERSLLPLWGSKWDGEKWIRVSENAVIHYAELVIAPNGIVNESLLKTLRAKGDIPIHWTQPVTLPHYITWIEEHLEQGEQLIKYFKLSPQLVSRLVAARNKLLHHYEMCNITYQGGNIRMAPAFIILYGETGVGKSNLQQSIPKAIARMNGYDESSGGVYDWMLDANFQHLSHQHWCVRMDDPGHGVAPPAAGVRNEIQEVMALVNNAPYPVEQADVTMKGKVFAYPSVVIVSTNYFTMRVGQLTRYTPAFWRRVTFHVEVLVKEKYRVDGGTSLDASKVSDSGSHDLHIFRVRVFDPTKKDSEKACLTEPKDMTYPEFLMLFHKTFRIHQDQQRALVMRAKQTGSWCMYCGLDSNGDCGHVFDYLTEDLPPAFQSMSKLEVKEEIVKDTPQGLTELVSSLAVSLAVSVIIWPCLRGPKGLRPLKADYYNIQSTFEKLVLSTLIKKAGYLALAGVALTMYQARENNAVDGWVPMNWQRAEQKFIPGIPAPASTATYTKEDLVRCIKESRVSVAAKMMGHGFLIGHNTVLTCTHFVNVGDPVKISYQGRDISFQVTNLNFRLCPSNPELCLLRNGEVFGNGSLINKIWSVVDQQVQQFDEVEIWADGLLYSTTRNQVKMNGAYKIVQTDAPSVSGDCGAAYVARFGSSWKVVALHYGSRQTTSLLGSTTATLAAVVTSLELKRMVESMGTTLQGVVTVISTLSKVPSEISCTPLGARSELWAAVSHHKADPYIIGELNPPLAGMTLKSKIVKSLMYDDASAEFEEEFCGQKGYWTIPEFRGRMDGEKWNSLWTNAFSSQNQVQPCEQLVIAALADYLYGMTDLSTEGFGKISEEQVLTGIPGSYINRINIKTSVGPPFNRGKRGYVALEAGNSYMAPEIWDMFDAIEQILESGHIPSFAGLGTAKDEPVKPGKYPRVFINLPFAANMHLKMRGAWKTFFRTNFAFFECAVGINMTSMECNKIVHLLKSVDESLTRLCDGDAKSLDKSWSGELWDFVALVIYAISFNIGVDPKQTYSLALGLKHTTYSFKNDLFRAWWNPSGNDWTVELNSILISLCERVIYYLHNPQLDYKKLNKWFETFFENPNPPDCGFTFRSNIAMVTYGDDNVKACASELPESYCRDWMDQLGIEMTDAQKTGQMKLVPLSGISFLKRDFVWDKELSCYLPPLSKKSIARMLLMKRDSTLTSIDHAAVVCSEALREAVYHGREFFERLDKFVEQQSNKLGFFENPLLVRKTYDFWREQIKDGSFQTWSNREPVDPAVVIWELDYAATSGVGIGPLETNFILQGKMNDVPIVNAGNDPASNEQVLGASAVVHDSGKIEFANSAVESLAPPKQVFHQQVPQNTLNDFLMRATELTTFSLADTDVQGIMTNIDPWYLFLSNSAVQDKVKNYSLIRGTLQVIFVCAIPGNAYGAYVLTALPNGATANVETVGALKFPNIMQTDHFVKIDCASSDDAVMQLGWLWPFDYADLPSGPVNSWKLYLSCLAPIATALPGAVVKGSIRVFANLMDDYEVSVPIYQGLKVNDAMKQHAPKTHARLTQVSSALSTVQSIAKKAEGLPMIGGIASTVGLVAGGAKEVMSWFGFTRALDYLAPMRITTRATSSLANVDGVDTSEVAALIQHNKISIDPLLVSSKTEDDMSFASLFSRWTLVKTKLWSTSATVGTSIFSIPVTPFYGIGDVSGANLSPAGYIGSMFEYWRGDMEYKIVIPVSKLHRGNLQVLWIPIGATVTTTPTNTTLNTVYDVACGEEKEFIIGYARAAPFLRVKILTDAISVFPVNVPNGYLVFRVITPLVSPNPTDLGVQVCVFARAKPNMEFAVPARFITYSNPAGTGLANYGIQANIYAQGTTGDEDKGVPERIALVQESGDFPADDLFFGEKIESVRALFQKPSRIGITANSLTTAFEKKEIQFSQLGFLTSLTPGDFTNWTWQGFLRPLFTGLAASERFKILASGPIWFGAVRKQAVNGFFDYGMQIPNTLIPWSCATTAAKGHEVQVPYYTGRKYILGRDGDPNAAGSEWGGDTSLYLQKEDGTTVVKYCLYYSYADDIRVTGFRQIPKLSFSDTAISYPVLF